jgi:hypothetical protein
MKRAAALVVVALGVVGCARGADVEHPLDDLTAAQRHYVLPDAEALGAEAHECPNDCPGDEWSAAAHLAWVEVRAFRNVDGHTTVRFDRVLSGRPPASPVATYPEPDGRIADATDLLARGIRVVAGIGSGANEPILRAIAAFDEQGRVTFVGRTGGYAAAFVAAAAERADAATAESYVAATLGWPD